jgi:ribonuclease-3
LLFDFFRRKRPKKLSSNLRDYLNRHISYRFHDTCLLEQAMTHRSYLQEGMERLISNERLEFLGDAVLGMVVTDELYHRFPEASEGELTRIKSTIVSREQLAKQARKIELGQFLFLGNGEEKSGGRRRPSILADGYEALLGAMYIDGGITEVRQFIRKYLLKDIDSLTRSRFHQNYKSWLLEYCQAEGTSTPDYRLISEKGPDHKKEFVVEVYVNKQRLGKGIGSSKKKAEQEGARTAIENLGLKDEYV